LTIENKGSIPHDQRQGIGKWIFGCDVCQQVCPWNNRFAQPTSDPAFEPRPFLRQAKLSDFLKLSPQDWRRPLRVSPLERPRRKGLVRNAAIIAGNLAREEWIDDLEHILCNEPDPQARAHAVWALKQINHPRSIKILKDQLARDQDPHVRQELERD
jgi:epoxyqueuosine reductase